MREAPAKGRETMEPVEGDDRTLQDITFFRDFLSTSTPFYLGVSVPANQNTDDAL